MRLASLFFLGFLCLGSAAPAAAYTTTHHPVKRSTAHSAQHTAAKHGKTASHTAARGKGRKRGTARSTSSATPMDSERATAIQTALIKRGYLTGEPSGKWDASSISAMQKLQSDNGWQSKVVPDARGLIKLGLGPQPVAPPAPQPQP